MEALIHEAEKLPDPQLRGQIQELVGHLLEFHGEALAKMVEDVADTGRPRPDLIDAWSRDELVSSLLLLYDLHPVDMESRVLAALEQVRPYLKSHGGNVEFLGLVDGVVHLRLEGHCHGCPSSTATLRSTIEKAIYEAAPDVAGIEVEGVVAAAGGRHAAVERILFAPADQGCHMIDSDCSTSANAEQRTRGPAFSAGRLAPLRAAPRPSARPVEKCELCSVRLPAEHYHLVDLRTRRLVCCCQPVRLLFSGRQSAVYRRVPLAVRPCPTSASPPPNGKAC